MTSGDVRKEAFDALATTQRCPKVCDYSSNEGLVDLVVVRVQVQIAAERDRGPVDLVVVLVQVQVVAERKRGPVQDDSFH
jgi:hypothetical protein